MVLIYGTIAYDFLQFQTGKICQVMKCLVQNEIHSSWIVMVNRLDSLTSGNKKHSWNIIGISLELVGGFNLPL